MYVPHTYFLILDIADDKGYFTGHIRFIQMAPFPS
jgi:hypothetical protein